MSDSRAAALAVYWRFFEGTNSRDPRQVTDALNYPHVRISARSNTGIAPDREVHTGKMSFDALLETGWDHTVGMTPEILHSSVDKVHIMGGWTRYNRDNQPIMSNLVTYIATRVDGRWGMQSRFGTDSDLFWGKPEDRPAEAAADLEDNSRQALAIVSSALTHEGNTSSQCFHYPYLVIHAGRIESITDAATLHNGLPFQDSEVHRVEAIQVGSTGVNVAFSATSGERLLKGVCMVKVDDGRWGIKGSSLEWK